MTYLPLDLPFFLLAVSLQTSFNFAGLAKILAGISFGLIGLIFVASWLFPEQAEVAKRSWLPNVIVGLILIGISSAIVGFF